MRITRILPLAALALLGGCYRVTVNTGAPPSTAVIDKPWQLSFAYGLVPPPELSAKEACPQGVATVTTERSFVNSVVGIITSSVVTPLHAKVTCASGPVAR